MSSGQPKLTREQLEDRVSKQEITIRRLTKTQLQSGIQKDSEKRGYEAYDPEEVDEVLAKFDVKTYEYSSNDFLLLGKYRLKEMARRHGNTIFYHFDTKKKNKNVFVPALLATFFEICYHVVTIKPTIYTPRDEGDMYYYDEELGMYIPNAEIVFSTYVKRLWDDTFKSSLLNETWKALRYETYIDREKFILESKYIPLENGILELYQSEEGKWHYKLIKNNPDLYVTERIPVPYDKDARAPQFLKFLDELLPQQHKEQKWIQEYTGYSLYRAWPFDKVVLMLGDGDNGKSTILESVGEVIGEHNITTIGVYELCNEPYQTAELYKKLANIDADTSTKDLKKTSKFKRATGGDRIQGRRIYKSPFSFKSYCKHWLSANLIPYSYDDTSAFFRRWIPIQFWQTFSAEDPNTDPNISDKLLTEKPGILNWALEGLLDLLNNKQFTDVPTADEVRILWNQLSNPIYAFLYSGAVIIDHLGIYEKQEFFEDFTNYCIEHRLPNWNKDKVGKRIQNKFDFIYNTRPTNPDGQRPPAWGGICPNPDYVKDVKNRHELQKAILILVETELQTNDTMTTNDLEEDLKVILQDPELKFSSLFGISGILDFLDVKAVILRSGEGRKTLRKGPNWEYSKVLMEDLLR